MASQQYIRSSLPCLYPPMKQIGPFHQGWSSTNKTMPPLISMTTTHARITRANVSLRCAAAKAVGSSTRLPRRGGSSRFAVKVFKPPVARSQECPANSVARLRAYISDGSVTDSDGIGGVDERGAKGIE